MKKVARLDQKTVVVTGGAGYIGSMVALALRERGHRTLVLDDLSRGTRAFLPEQDASVASIVDLAALRAAFAQHRRIDAVVHCAAFTSVPESVADPALYARVNVAGTANLVQVLQEIDCPGVVYSGSAAIYATNAHAIRESDPIDPSSPYGQTKLDAEGLLKASAAAGGPRLVSLRYFNPVGAHPQARRGPHRRMPTAVTDRLLQCVRETAPFSITGTDFETRDGTGLRDFVDVWDLAQAHVTAVERLTSITSPDQPSISINLGSGRGVTVRELVTTVQRCTRRPVQTAESPRRPGDIAAAVANIERANKVLNWHPTRDIGVSIEASLRWLDRRVGVLGY